MTTTVHNDKTAQIAGGSVESRRPDSNRGPLHYEFRGMSYLDGAHDLEKPEKWAISEGRLSRAGLDETTADNSCAPVKPPLRAVAA